MTGFFVNTFSCIYILLHTIDRAIDPIYYYVSSQKATPRIPIPTPLPSSATLPLTSLALIPLPPPSLRPTSTPDLLTTLPPPVFALAPMFVLPAPKFPYPLALPIPRLPTLPPPKLPFPVAGARGLCWVPRHCALGGVGGFISSGLGRKFSLSMGEDCGSGVYVFRRCLNSIGGEGCVIQFVSETVEGGRVELGRVVESL